MKKLNTKTNFIKKVKSSKPSYETLNEYKYLSSIKTQTKDEYLAYHENIANYWSKDPANFWSFIKSHRNSNGVPKEMNFQNQTVADPQSIADGLAQYFSAVFF